MQQRVEILKVLYRGASIIVLDEPTAVLTPQEITSLLTIIEELRRDGKTIIFISHKLEEVKQVADNVTVIRLGKVIETFESKSKTKEEIATLMVGRDLVDIRNQGNVVLGPVLLKIDNLFVHKIGNKKSIMGLSDFSLEVKSREIVAIAGIEGNGQTELISAITGLIKPEKGDIFW